MPWLKQDLTKLPMNEEFTISIVKLKQTIPMFNFDYNELQFVKKGTQFQIADSFILDEIHWTSLHNLDDGLSYEIETQKLNNNNNVFELVKN